MPSAWGQLANHDVVPVAGNGAIFYVATDEDLQNLRMLLMSFPSHFISFLLVWVVHGWQQQQQQQPARTRRATAAGGGFVISRGPWVSPAASLRHDTHHPWVVAGRPLVLGTVAGSSPRSVNWKQQRLASTVSDNSDGLTGGSPSQQGDDCPSEEECEIDWDKMPGFAEENGGSSSSSSSSGGENQPQQATGTASSTRMAHEKPVSTVTSVESTRLRLEMMWQLEEAAEDCEVERPETCGSRPCGRCRGRGLNTCRFCGGRQVLGFERERPDGTTQSALYACTVCDRGFEACDACRGTGWVADWTLLTPGTSTPAAAR